MAEEAFPLHYLVWNNQYLELDRELQKNEHDMERLDPRGRSPLELSVFLQEAVSTGDPELVQLVLQYRDFRRATERLAGIPELLSKLRQARDFYVEMKWEFTSWVPLVSKVCPSDVYRVWKSGSCLRVDTTLLGFEHMTWLKGRRSYIFKGGESGAMVMEVDHEKQVVYTEPLSLSPRDAPSLLAAMLPSQENTAQRLTSPIVNKSGIWGWRSEKTEVVSGYEAKVYSASNVELVTRSRTEHLSDQDKSRSKGSRTPLQSFLGIAEQHISSTGSQVSQCASPHNPTAITAEEYFDAEFNLNGRDIGRPIELTSKVQRFKATLWLSEAHPLSLAEQVTPIIDLMAISNAHFAKLRDFITLRLPPGFPVKIGGKKCHIDHFIPLRDQNLAIYFLKGIVHPKIVIVLLEIPLFHVLNARVTFSNLCGCDEPVSSVIVQSPQGATEAGQTPPPLQCEVDPSVFEPPPEYTTLGPGRSEPMRDEDDNLLQFAIQQSLLDAGTESDQVTIWEALTNTRPVSQPPLYEEDSQLERAIQESLSLSLAGGDSGESDGGQPLSPSDPALISPPCYSSLTEPRAPGAKRREEEEELERILQLSLTEK
ncbi:Ankyrin repeat domain-containing protein 13D [Labeo rohita]|uniref:Ankyrin repeat domain-containing protein 13D n=1 Tax=Labeo rohita TaxID=84645 RepID=A0ABQ8M2R7_LABRO|nr:Ankyrin repeat domain-containing protein 13D [Labeo rohita]